jgi:hypothetical protein
MSVYGALRAGYGVNLDFFIYYEDNYYGDRYSDSSSSEYFGGGFCYELEVGLNLTRNFFIAYAYNYQNVRNFEYRERSLKLNSHALRIGFNFGK